MKNQLIVVVLVLGTVLGTSPAPAQTPAYHANLLGISDGRTSIEVEHPSGLNRWGQVIGTYGGGLSGGTHAVLWTPNPANDGFGSGTLFSLELSKGLPAGTADTWPTGINDRGQIVGGAFTPGKGDGNQDQSWMWKPGPLNASDGTMLNSGKGRAIAFPLLNIPGLGTLAEDGESINNNGIIAAHGIYYHPLLWNPAKKNGTAGTWTYEPVYSAPPSGINDAGQIAGGTIESGSENVPYLHTGAFPLLTSDLITSPLWLQPPTPNGIGGASGLNQQGDLSVTAVDVAGTQVRAYLYKNGAATDLSTGLQSQANAINNYDQVVGHADTDTRRAILFENGSALDLNTLNDSTNGLFLREAIAINDAGQILCSGNYPGAGATVLLTPAANWIQPVTVTTGKIQKHGSTASQTVTVTNTGTKAIPGSISIALDGLTSGVTLTNATGTTKYAGPFGSQYVDVSSSDLASGATTPTFTLTFSNPGNGAIKYKARVLATAAPR
jgi:probable HAF family extracellular repeat protein